MSVYANKSLQQRIQRTVADNKEALRTARTKAASTKREVERSNIVVDRAVKRLKRAGVLKK